jgi:hypothetical protein
VRPVAGRLEGWTGYLLLADRSTNRIMAIGFWESAAHTEAAIRDPAFIASLPHEDYANGEVSLRYVDVDLVDEAAG